MGDNFAIFILIKVSGIQIEGCDPVILQISYQSIGQSLVVQNSGLKGFVIIWKMMTWKMRFQMTDESSVMPSQEMDE